MSEGYLCDRCGSTHAGKPDTMLIVGDGRKRTRKKVTEAGDYEETGHPNYGIGDSEHDLCASCMNDLRRWYADAGGDATAIEHRDGDTNE